LDLTARRFNAGMMPESAKAQKTSGRLGNNGKISCQASGRDACQLCQKRGVAQLGGEWRRNPGAVENALPRRVSPPHTSAVPPSQQELPKPKSVSNDGRALEIFWSDASTDPAWDDFVLAQPDGHHEQTSLWGDVRRMLGWRVVRVTLRERGAVIGGAQVQLRRVRRIGQWAYITFGPVVARGDLSVEKILLAELKHFLRQERARYLLAQLPYDAGEFGSRLLDDGFIKAPLALAPSNMTATLLLDLKKSEAQMLAEMHPVTRKQIRQGLKRGLVIERGGAADLDEFWRLMCALCVRRKTVPNPASPEFFHELWKRFSPRGWMQVYVAKLEGKTVAGQVAFRFGDWFRVWKIGWDGAHAELRPTHLLYWKMICAAKEQGCRHFDFVNLDLQPSGLPVDGAAEFKLGFGGEVKKLPGVFCHFTNPLLRGAMRAGGATLLDSNRSVRLARRLARG
jgi:lipid II:glycine glycyltransferase (peptidoglycan interpeptide bridge formation enzyme)